jgi:membrane protein DedA with SNARE-associated domain
VHPMPVLVVDAVAHAGVGGYVILYLGVVSQPRGLAFRSFGAGVLAGAGVVASEGEVNLWLVILVATVAAWTGGYVGYLIGVRAGDAVSERPGRRQRQRQRAMSVGERIYRR